MSARDFALIELDRRNLPGWPAHALRGKTRDSTPPVDSRDYALAEHLLIGTIKNLLHLQHLTMHFSTRRLNEIEPLVCKILAIALYQLRFMDRIPASAAVDEAVEQARRFGLARAGGFVNAVLRNATREPDVRLPTVSEDPRKFAELVLSHPSELFDAMVNLVDVEQTMQIARHNNQEPPTLVRLFRDVQIGRLASDGVRILAHEQSGMCVVENAKRNLLADWANHGLAQVQDATAARVVEMMQLQAGNRVLDRCAGLGTKTLQIQDMLRGSGTIVAIDPRASAMNALRKLIATRGIENVETILTDRIDERTAPTPFDRILIDSPCSNSGVLARRPEARYMQDSRSMSSVRELQRSLLTDSARVLAPNGRLIYSTCSIWREENERQVEWFLERQPQFQVVAMTSTLPSTEDSPAKYHDGGFTAVLRST